MRRKLYLLAAVFVFGLAIVAAGCPAQEETTTTTEEETTTTVGEPTGGPKVEFVSPTEGAEVTGPDVKAEIKVENFQIVNKLSQPNVEGEGHIHWIVDNQSPYTAANAETTLTATGLKSGEHTIKAELHQNQHEPLDPPAEAEVKFTVK